jgi:putative ABC transport system permease protein
MTSVIQDLRYGLRMLMRAPAFTAIAVVTLALGIGANTAIFSVVNALLLRPLPYPHPQQLVVAYQDLRARGGPAIEWATPGNFADWQASGIFASIAAVQGWQPALTGVAEPEPLTGEQVSRAYFDVLGAQPELGRVFNAAEDLPNAARVVVLSHTLWQRRFNGDPTIVGRSIVLGGEPHEVIGVMPSTLRPAIVPSAELWRPRRLNLVEPSRGAVVLRVVGRLRPDLTITQASSSAAVLAQQLAKAYPEFNQGAGINLVPLHTVLFGDIQQGLLVLLGAVGFVLLIACANVANLLLARATGRGREIAVRLAIGAARWRLVRQLLTESLLLAVIGGVGGLMIGVWGVDALTAIAPQGARRAGDIGLDATVLAFAFGLTIVTGVIFGLAPALHASRTHVAPALKEGGRGTAGSGASRVRRALIVLEVAVALVLLVGSGLLMQTLLRLERFDLGFTPDGVVVGQVLPPRVKYPTQEQQVAFYDRLLARVSILPGVETAALSSVIPLGGDNDMDITIEGRPAPTTEAEATTVWYRIVSAGYFDVMRTPLAQGRAFDAREPAPSVIVSETSARRFWGETSPLGRRVRFGGGTDAPWFTVIGVAKDVQMRGARGGSRSEVYLPYWQFPELGTNVFVRTTGRPEALTSALRLAVRDVDPDIPVSNIAAMTTIVADSIDQPRFFARLVAIFAAIALGLAAIGIYGVIAFGVALRTSEIGVRLALGASRRDIVALIAGDGLKLTSTGILIGMIAAGAVSMSLRSLLFGVEPLDTTVFVAMTALLVVASAVACALPARRAVTIDPIVALRSE